jgi:hypothetical protein
MTIFKKITEATLLTEKKIKENKELSSLSYGVEKIFPDIPRRNKDIITMRVWDNLEKKGISFSF